MSLDVIWLFAVCMIALQACAAQNACRPNTQCTAPTDRNTPDGQVFLAVWGDELARNHMVTEPELKAYCKQRVGILICMANYLLGCLPEGQRDALQPLAHDSLKLGAVCHRPDVYAKFSIIHACDRAMEAKLGQVFRQSGLAEYQRYNEEMSQCAGGQRFTLLPAFLVAEQVQFRDEDFAVLTEATAVRAGLCCYLKKLSVCVPATSVIRESCTAEFLELSGIVLGGLMNNYNCSEALATTVCPP